MSEQQSTTPKMLTGAPQPDAFDSGLAPSPDEITLHLIASGLMELASLSADGRPLTLPYPDPLQRGLDRMVATCVRRGVVPPQGVPDLLAWCRRPLIEWQLDLPAERFQLDPTDQLLDGQFPTELCKAWEYGNGDVEAEVRERRLLEHVLNTCRTADAPDAYSAFRKFLIEHVVLTAFELQKIRIEPAFELVAEHIQTAYSPAPLACVMQGELHCCSICGNLLLRTVGNQLVCENERCRRSGRSTSGRRISSREDVLWLRPEFRRFIAQPGQAELRLAQRITKLGIKVTLWPAFDAYDLQLVFRDNEAWAVDVKDWADPFRLARSVKPIPSNPPWARAFFVFPEDRRRERPDYVRAFRHHCRILSDRVHGDFERDFVNKVLDKLGRTC